MGDELTSAIKRYDSSQDNSRGPRFDKEPLERSPWNASAHANGSAHNNLPHRETIGTFSAQTQERITVGPCKARLDSQSLLF